MVLLLHLFQITQITPAQTETVCQQNILNSFVTLLTFPVVLDLQKQLGGKLHGQVQQRVGTPISALGLPRASAFMDLEWGRGLGSPGGWPQHPGSRTDYTTQVSGGQMVDKSHNWMIRGNSLGL